MHQDKNTNAWQSRINSFGYAFKGIKVLFKSQPNARIHAAITTMVIIFGLLFHLSLLEWAIIVLAIGLVLAAEAFNTALEYLTDLVSPDFHPMAGKVKDVSAGAVLISAICAAIMGLLIFIPKFVALL